MGAIPGQVILGRGRQPFGDSTFYGLPYRISGILQGVDIGGDSRVGSWGYYI